jgi:hypothetical protein
MPTLTLSCTEKRRRGLKHFRFERPHVFGPNTMSRTVRKPQAVTDGAVTSLAAIGTISADSNQIAAVDPTRQTRLTATNR